MSFDAVADFALSDSPIPEYVLARTALLLIDTLAVAVGAAVSQADAHRFADPADDRQTITHSKTQFSSSANTT